MTREDEDTDNEVILDVLDFPQLYTRPSLASLLTTLDLLAIPPPSWETTPSPTKTVTNHPIIIGNPTRWLTSLVASPLKWLPEEYMRELIWETASVRLSERCGRTAMPALDREFKVCEGVKVKIHEPTLDGDNLGLKTWGAAYLLGKRVCGAEMKGVISGAMDAGKSRKVLELGAGTGLVGIAAAAGLSFTSDGDVSEETETGVKEGVRIHLTDLPEIVPNLQRNVEKNEDVIAENVCVSTGVLDWRLHDEATDDGDRYPVILAADALYSTEHPDWLSTVVVGWLEKSHSARFIVELPLRKRYGGEVVEFRRLMGEKGFKIVQEGEEEGRDDWGSGSEGESMRCWWAVYGWGDAQVNA